MEKCDTVTVEGKSSTVSHHFVIFIQAHDFNQGRNVSKNTHQSLTLRFVALMLAQDPFMSIDDIYRRLSFSATDMGTAGFDIYYGHGMANPFKALSEDYYNDGTLKTLFLTSPDEFELVRYDYSQTGMITGGAAAAGFTET